MPLTRTERRETVAGAIHLRATPILWGLACAPFGIGLLASGLGILVALLGKAVGLSETFVAMIAIAAVLASAFLLGREPRDAARPEAASVAGADAALL
jgi:hypothetical protein